MMFRPESVQFLLRVLETKRMYWFDRQIDLFVQPPRSSGTSLEAPAEGG
jgi:hypothetical protein